MMASQFSRSCDSCQRNVTGCLATCWMVQNASWSQFDPGNMTTPNFMHSSETRLHASLAWVKLLLGSEEHPTSAPHYNISFGPPGAGGGMGGAPGGSGPTSGPA